MKTPLLVYEEEFSICKARDKSTIVRNFASKSIHEYNHDFDKSDLEYVSMPSVLRPMLGSYPVA